MIDLNKPTDEIVKTLQAKSIKVPAWEKIRKLYDPNLHRVMTDKNLLKDKVRSDGTIEPSTRIPVAIERLATSRMSEFCFAIPVKREYSHSEENDATKQAIQAIEAVYKHVRIDSINYQRGVALFASCEVCTVWYAVERPNRLYGFESKYKLRCKTFSPMEGYELYPLFDREGDMLAMSFGYTRREEEGEREYLETFTDTKHFVFSRKGEAWTIESEEEVSLMKIPAVYMYRDSPIFSDITPLREELELSLSRNGNVVAYNSAPILKVSGQMISDGESRGETRRIYRVEQGGDISYVSWSQSVDALKFQVDNLLRLIFMQLQLPDLSFDAMKSLGSIGYDARQTLLADAHLKVGDEKHRLIEFLEREFNVIREFLKLMNVSLAPTLDDLECEHIITPFVQNDEKADIERRILANGGKPLESHIESIRRLGWSTDPEKTLQEIQAEEERGAMTAKVGDLFSPTI